jgi:Protein of unknown function (DUF3313)
MRCKTWIVTALLALLAVPALAADSMPTSWDGLVEVKSKRLDAAYLAPGADFRPYTKIMVDPTQAAFHKDWMKNMNDRRDLSRKIDSTHAAEVLEAAKTNFADVFAKEFEKAGFTIVTAPGPDVLRVSPGVVNLYINAPDVMAAGRSTSYTASAGEATMVLELRDSTTNALIGRVLDRRETRESVGMQQSNRVTNTSDFRMLFKSWAGISAKGLDALKSVSPLPETLTPGQKLD